MDLLEVLVRYEHWDGFEMVFNIIVHDLSVDLLMVDIMLVV